MGQEKLTEVEKTILEIAYVGWEAIQILYKSAKADSISFSSFVEALVKLFNTGYLDCQLEDMHNLTKKNPVSELTKEELLEYYGGDLSDDDIEYYPPVAVHEFKTTLKGDKLYNKVNIEDAEKRAELNPGDPRSHYMFALALEFDLENRLVCYLRAEQEYLKTIKLDPNFTTLLKGHPYTRLAELYIKINQKHPQSKVSVKNIENAYKRGIKSAPDHHESWHAWGKYLESKKIPHERVLEAYQMAIARVPIINSNKRNPSDLMYTLIIKSDIRRIQEFIKERDKTYKDSESDKKPDH